MDRQTKKKRQKKQASTYRFLKEKKRKKTSRTTGYRQKEKNTHTHKETVDLRRHYNSINTSCDECKLLFAGSFFFRSLSLILGTVKERLKSQWTCPNFVLNIFYCFFCFFLKFLCIDIIKYLVLLRDFIEFAKSFNFSSLQMPENVLCEQ